MVTVHKPPVAIDLPSTQELYFLAGPIQGAPEWHEEAIRIIDELAGERDVHVANPKRKYIDGTFDYEGQVGWERRHIRRAADYGAVLFWFAKQDPSLPHDPERAYAQTSRFEFGRALGWLDDNPAVRIAIGMEPGYHGSERYIRSCAAESGLVIHDSLEETCATLLTSKTG